MTRWADDFATINKEMKRIESRVFPDAKGNNTSVGSVTPARPKAADDFADISKHKGVLGLKGDIAYSKT